MIFRWLTLHQPQCPNSSTAAACTQLIAIRHCVHRGDSALALRSRLYARNMHEGSGRSVITGRTP